MASVLFSLPSIHPLSLVIVPWFFLKNHTSFSSVCMTHSGQTECTLDSKSYTWPRPIATSCSSSPRSRDPEQTNQNQWNSVQRFTGAAKAFYLYRLCRFEDLCLEMLGPDLRGKPPKDNTLHGEKKRWRKILDLTLWLPGSSCSWIYPGH